MVLAPHTFRSGYEASLGASIYSSTRDEGTGIPQYEVHRNGAYVVEPMDHAYN